MFTSKQLDDMKKLKLENRKELVNIRNIKIDSNLPPEQRMIDYLEKVKNPYCFLWDDTVVNIKFESTDSESSELKNKLKNFFINLKTN